MTRRIYLMFGVALVVLVSVWAMNRAAVQSSQSKPRWYKGNTHTHTLNSDGDSTADEVARWYRENRYHFLVLTDHNYLTAVEGLNALHGADEKFLVIRGEEITDEFDKKPLHINGLDVERLVPPQGGKSVTDVLQRDIDAIRAARGVPHINHPNFGWAITTEDLKPLKNNRLFEIFNGHPQVNNLGGGGFPGLEEMWDILLSNGRQLYGIAVDDAHVFKRPWDRTAPRPGQGWVMVRAERLAVREILGALERGDFYATTGVELDDYQVSEKEISIRIREFQKTKYRVQFIGRDGRALREVATNPAVYAIRGNEGYVRARVIDSNGQTAWTQPVFPSPAR
ncbi:MAG: CehA/McbA family metallohydrolase [Blastocatellia bacterium]